MIRAAVCQLRLELGKIDSNVSASVAAIREAAGRGARLVVLPELADSGYVVADVAEARDWRPLRMRTRRFRPGRNSAPRSGW